VHGGLAAAHAYLVRLRPDTKGVPLTPRLLSEITRAAAVDVPEDHAGWARWCLREAERRISARSEPSEEPSHPDARLARLRELRVDAELILLYSDSAVIYSAMAVESFLNFYGVTQLSEAFFRPSLERLNPTQKLPLLLLATRQLVLEPDDEIVSTVRSLFDARNTLVHPKTRELAPEEAIRFPGLPNYNDAQVAVRRMDRFFQLFKALDPNADFGFRGVLGAA
jgi:hypothetical protein